MAKEPIIVIGGGAAGMMAAGRAAQLGAQVLLLEKNKMLGRKLRITGKGRCNVTNTGDMEQFIKNFPGQGSFLYSAFHKFFNKDLQAFFQAMGVPLKEERGGRVFPVSDKAQDIVEALEKYLRAGNVEIKTETEVVELLRDKNKIKGVKTNFGNIYATKVIVATGGKSYPGTGSTGDGYLWAEEMGYSLIPLKPALVPLNIEEDWVKDLQGLSLKNVEASIIKGKKVIGRDFGEMVFTHFGVSGPIVLTLSRQVVKSHNANEKLVLSINLKPALDEVTLDARLQRDFQKNNKKQLKNALFDLLPKRLAPIVIMLSEIDPDKYVHQITKGERRTLLKSLQEMKMTIKGPRSLSEAIVTAGGISLKEINPKSMESKIIKGLYFVGEVMDIDGYTGGYNLQAAFSTGYVAGEQAVFED